MEGITNWVFRELMVRHGGLGVVCTEFVRITGVSPKERYLRRQVVHAERTVLSVQVMGNDLENMAQAAEIVARAGADVVDLNVGCPAPNAVRKGVGSALLNNPGLLFAVVSSMRARTPGLLSAKIRAGLDSSAGAVATAELIEAAGADYITVHPRRGVDHYKGVADWRIIRDIKRRVGIPVVGNGDIWCAADAERMRRETGCDAVMIGRGALRNPWIFAQIDALGAGRPPPRPTGDDVLAHFDELFNATRAALPKAAFGIVKDHLRYLCRIAPDDAELPKKALRAQSEIELRRVLDRAFSTKPHSALRLSPDGR